MTALGEDRLRFALGERVAHKPIPTPPFWDGKCRIVLFDIPEKHRHGRDALRNAMQSLCFHQLQKSAWAYPFPCKKEIMEIAARFDIKPYVKVLTVEDISDEGAAAHFRSLLKDIPRKNND
ncbi:MAG: hypothetical protein AAB604_01765 [Patescibacteria group bacterium]